MTAGFTGRRLPLGTFVGARSGDKGGAANVGLWVVDPVEPIAVAFAHRGSKAPETAEMLEAAFDLDASAVALADARYAWLEALLTEERVRELLPETAGLRLDIVPLPNLRAVNIVVHGLLGRGVAETSRIDPQAKGLGEHLRARLVDIPDVLLIDGGDLP